MLIHCVPQRKSADKNNRDMLQSPRGSINNFAHNFFQRDIPNRINIDTPGTTLNSTLQKITPLQHNQMVNNNSIKYSSYSISKHQLAYAKPKSHIVQSGKNSARSKPILGSRCEPTKWMFLVVEWRVRLWFIFLDQSGSSVGERRWLWVLLIQMICWSNFNYIKCLVPL